MKHNVNFQKDNLRKLLAVFILPSLAQMAVSSVYDVINRLFAIQGVGINAVSAMTLASPLVNLTAAFCVLVSSGTSVIYTIKRGEGDSNESRKVVGNSLLLSLIVGIVTCAILSMFSQHILSFFGKTGSVSDYEIQYIKIFAFCPIFQVAGYSLSYTIRAQGRPLFSLLTVVSGVVVNMIFDVLFIFVFRLGIKGIAFSTLISQVAAVIIGIYILTKSNDGLRLELKDFKLKCTLVRDILKNGLPLFLFMILVSITLSVTNAIFLKYYRNDGLALIGIISVIYTMLQMIIMGVSNGIAPIIGHNYGAKCYKRVKSTVKISIILSTIFCVTIFAVIMIFSKYIMSAFLGGNQHLLETGSICLKIMCLGLPVVGFTLISTGYFQAIGNYKTASTITVFREAILIIPLLVILSQAGGIYGSFFAYPLTEIISAIIVLTILLIMIRKRNAIKEVNDN